MTAPEGITSVKGITDRVCLLDVSATTRRARFGAFRTRKYREAALISIVVDIFPLSQFDHASAEGLGPPTATGEMIRYLTDKSKPPVPGTVDHIENEQ